MSNEIKITDVVEKKAFEQLKNLRDQYQKFGEYLIKLNSQLVELSNVKPSSYGELEKKAKEYADISSQIVKVHKEMASVQKQQVEIYNRLNSVLATLSKNMSNFTDHVTNASKALGESTSTINTNASASEKGAQSTDQYAKSMQDASASISQAKQSYTDIIASIKAYDDSAQDLNLKLTENKTKLEGLKASQKALDSEYKKGKIELANYNKQRAELINQERELTQQNQQYSALLRTHATVVISTSQSYNEMNAAVLQLEKRFKDLNETQRNGVVGQTMVKQIDELKSELKTIDASLGNYQRNVGNYSSAWNGLNYQFQMIARELPNLGISFQTFIISLSNNIPYLIDELNKARIAHKEYIAQVKAGNTTLQSVPSVLAQSIKSIVNWQTLIIVGVTLLTAYSKEISNWVKELFNAKKGIDGLLTSEQELALVRRKGITDSIKERTELSVLYKATQDATRSMDERKAAIKRLKELYPSYFSNMSDEEILAGDAALAYSKLTQQLINTAKAKAYLETLTQNTKTLLSLEIKRANAQATLRKEQKSYNDLVDQMNGRRTLSVVTAERNINKAQRVYDNLLRAQISIRQNNEKIENEINSTDLIADPKQDKNKFKKTKAENAKIEKEEERHQKYMKKLQAEILSATASASEQAYQTDVLNVEAWYNDKLSIIKNGESKVKEYQALSAEERIKAYNGEYGAELELIAKLEEAKARKIKDITVEYNLEVEKSNIENRLATIRGNNEKEIEERTNLQRKLNEVLRKEEIRSATQRGVDINNINEKYIVKDIDIVANGLKERIALNEKSLKQEEKDISISLQNELNELDLKYSNGYKNKEEYEKRKLALTLLYAKKSLELQIHYAEKSIKATEKVDDNVKKELLEEIERLKQYIKELEAELGKVNIDIQINTGKSKSALGELGEWYDKIIEDLGTSPRRIVEAFEEVFSQLSDVMSHFYQNQIDVIDNQIKANKDASDEEIDRIEKKEEQGVIKKEEAEAAKRASEEKTAQRNKELEKEKVQLQIKQARWNKANAAVQTFVNTAEAVMKAYTLGPIIGAIYANIMKFLGAAEVAAIIAQPIPKYAKGTDKEGHPGGPAIVGDGGKREIILTKARAYLTPDVPTLVDLPKGAQVIPSIDDIKIKSEVMKYIIRNEEERQPPLSISVDVSSLENEVRETNRLLARMIKQEKEIRSSQDLANYIRSKR